MPGSGKSTLGVQLANALQLKFVDLDKEIEKNAGKTIPDIFLHDGEEKFRLLESALLKKLAKESTTFVMATGGGAPCFHKGIEIINEAGVSLFLDVPLTELVKRLQSKTGRPLLDNDLSEKQTILERLREARLSCYRQANITIQNPDLDKVLEAIHFFRTGTQR